MAGLYIHIPFCKRRCSYCDFYSVAGNAYFDRYVDALVEELALRRSEVNLRDVRTIYLGGGTPSVLSHLHLGRLIDGLAKYVDMARAKEFTMEVNPDDITADYIYNVKKCGVNRISMGVQSFVDSELKTVNRRHDARQAEHAVELIREAGVTNISIDLIYGLPGQTIDSWRYSVDKAIAMNVNHISAYCLSYEEGTALTLLRDRGKITEIDEDTCVNMYDELCSRLAKAGYEHYEISNFALPGMYSKHNSSYWNGTPYLGLGAAAHSYDGTCRRYNPSNIKEYLTELESGKLACEAEEELWWQRYNEMIMVRLRTKWGVRLDDINREFGSEMGSRFQRLAKPYVAAGELICHGDGTYVLSEKGVMISDAVIRDLMYIEED